MGEYTFKDPKPSKYQKQKKFNLSLYIKNGYIRMYVCMCIWMISRVHSYCYMYNTYANERKKNISRKESSIKRENGFRLVVQTEITKRKKERKRNETPATAAASK